MFWTSAELSSSLNMVTDSMTHALFSTKPRTRYYPGFLSGLFVSWMSLLPAEMSDFIFVNILIKLATGKSIPVPKAAELQKS